MKASTTLIAIALLGALAIPAAAQAQSVGEDSVTGSGTADSGALSFALDAHSGPSGENPTGTAATFLTSEPNIFARGSVTCLAVQGKTAVIGIANDPGSVGLGTLIEVTDDPDTFAADILISPATDCSSGPNNPATPVSSGDITITDASPLPTSKGQCTNGGWRTFPGFRDQGDCVSFVATKGKNPPAQP
jgi:hypothetical protein